MYHGWQWPRCSEHHDEEDDEGDDEHDNRDNDDKGDGTTNLVSSPLLISSRKSPTPRRSLPRPPFRRESSETAVTMGSLSSRRKLQWSDQQLHSRRTSITSRSADGKYVKLPLVFVVEGDEGQTPPSTKPTAVDKKQSIEWSKQYSIGRESCDMFRESSMYWKLAVAVLAAALFAETMILGLFRTTILCRSRDGVSIVPQHTTDFPGLPIPTSYQTTRFDFSLRASKNGTLHPFYNHTQPVYVGTPSPAIDRAWHNLIGDRYFRLTSNEVSELNDDLSVSAVTPLPAWKDAVAKAGPYGGIDMMHSLHCINSLRKALHPSYYEEQEMLLLPGETMWLHLDHCLEQLRQAILCHGDTTPVTLKPIVTELEDGRRVLTMLGETEREHTCRDAEPILAWVREQAKARGSV